MKLIPVDEKHCQLVSDWLTEPSNRQWLDFGGAHLSPLSIRVMTQKPAHCLRLFTPDDDNTPIGVVGLSEIHPAFGTAQLWYVLGDKTRGGRGYTSRAVSRMLGFAFSELGLRSVNAWAVERNAASIAVLKTNGFREAGRLRGAHEISGSVYDRVLFDLLATEYGGVHEQHGSV